MMTTVSLTTRAVCATVIAVTSMFLAACFLTGSTDGYEKTPEEAGSGAGNGNGEGGGGAGLSLGCLSVNDCPSDGGVAQACCLATTGGSTASACQAAPCTGTVPIQICKISAECTNAACTLQSCPYLTSTISFRACGSLPTCTPE